MADTQIYDKEKEKEGGFGRFIWNSSTKEFCGRTASSWFKIVAFYIIFYLCLAAFWALMLVIFRTTLSDKAPKWELDKSQIGENPGLGYRPRPPKDKIESTLIKFGTLHTNRYKHWVNDLQTFISSYENPKVGGTSEPVDCTDGVPKDRSKKFCNFQPTRLIQEGCTAEEGFGYRHGSPCVLIKLNRIFNWKPVCYTYADLSNSSMKLDPKLREAIESVHQSEMNFTAAARAQNNEYIYITCEGQNSADKENIGNLRFLPYQGINSYYFPFQNQDNYLSPFVFVKFENPKKGIVINIECKAWAKNIIHDLTERVGSVHFELDIEN